MGTWKNILKTRKAQKGKTMQKLTEKQKKIKNLITPLVKSIMNEAYVPKPGTYKLEMTVENDGSVVIKSGDIGFRILANLIGVG